MKQSDLLKVKQAIDKLELEIFKLTHKKYFEILAWKIEWEAWKITLKSIF